MKIKEAGQYTGISEKTIRYYEQEGLIAPFRDKNTNYRIFSDEDIKRLKEIKLYRNLDIGIDDIMAILTKTKTLEQILVNQIQKLGNKIKHLEQIRQLSINIGNEAVYRDKITSFIYDLEDIIYEDLEMVKRKVLTCDKKIIALAALGSSPQVNIFLGEIVLDLELEISKLKHVLVEHVEQAQAYLLELINK